MSDSIDVIIVLPGLTGSTLGESQNSLLPLWPSGALAAATATATTGLAFWVKDAVASLGGALWPIEPLGASKGDFYGQFLNSLATSLNDAGGDYSVAYTSWPTINYEESNIYNVEYTWLNSENGNKLSGNSLIGWAYDWRQDNIVSAKMLQNLLYNLCHANDNIGSITLIGHSMGGVVARCYLESVGTNDPWFSKISQFISLGTPAYGAPLALNCITAPVPSIATSALASTVILSDPTFPISNGGNWLLNALGELSSFIQAAIVQNMQYIILSTLNYSAKNGLANPGTGPYQLLPPPEVGFIAVEGESAEQPISPFSKLPGSMQEYLDNIHPFETNYVAAQNLWNSLTYSGSTPVPYNCVYGIVSSAYTSPNVKLTTTITEMTYSSSSTPPFSATATDGGGDTVVPYCSASYYAPNLGPDLKTIPPQNPSLANPPLQVNAVVGFDGVDHDNMPNFPQVQTQIMKWLVPNS
ncbi:alpha/beta hydrolase [Nitrospirillum sp. BR 11752]|uniref:esterase/lipase family protein n=1 Tax=Nitrospirillum sp. BR 11752 TaxID=3104293 RepID=UPI002EBE5E10|nr:alpha/beta hydrolase [Nitrospirillum sp. BR 11752]